MEQVGGIMVQIGADVSGLERGTRKAVQKLDELGKGSSAARAQVERLAAAGVTLTRESEDLSTALSRQSTALDGTARGYQTNTSAAGAFARVEEKAAMGAYGLAQAQGRVALALRENAAAIARVQALYQRDPSDASRARIERLTGSLLANRAALQQQASAYDGVNRGGSAANRILLELGRASQDAAQFNVSFAAGLQAVSNQAEGVALSYAAMKRQAEIAGTTVKAQLLGSLAGPGGFIALAGIASTVALTFGDEISEAFRKGAREADLAREAFRDAISEILDFQAAGQQVALTSAAQSATLARGAAGEIARIKEELRGLGDQQRLANIGAVGSSTLPGVGRLSGEDRRAFDERAGQIASLNRELDEYRAILEDANAKTRRFNALARAASAVETIGGTLTPVNDRTPDRTRSRGRAPSPAAGLGAAVDAEVSEAARAIARLRAALDTRDLQLSGLVGAGEITALEGLNLAARSLRSALEEAYGVDSAEGRSFASDLRTELEGVRLSALLLGVATGEVEFPPIGSETASATRSTEDLRATVQGLRTDYETAESAVTRVDDAARKLAKTAQTVGGAFGQALDAGASAFASDLSGLIDFEVFGGRADYNRDLAAASAEARERIAELQAELAAGAISQGTFEDRVAGINAELARIRSSAPSVAGAFKNLARSILADLSRLLVKAVAVQGILAALNLIPGFGASGIGGAIISGLGAATGGNLTAPTLPASAPSLSASLAFSSPDLSAVRASLDALRGAAPSLSLTATVAADVSAAQETLRRLTGPALAASLDTSGLRIPDLPVFLSPEQRAATSRLMGATLRAPSAPAVRIVRDAYRAPTPPPITRGPGLGDLARAVAPMLHVEQMGHARLDGMGGLRIDARVVAQAAVVGRERLDAMGAG